MEIIEKSLINLLKNDYSKSGKISKEKLYAKTYAYDENLIRLLLSDKLIRDKFFVKIDQTYIFKLNEFVDFINNHDLVCSKEEIIDDIGYFFYPYDYEIKIDEIPTSFLDNIYLENSSWIDFKFQTKFLVRYKSKDDNKEIRELGQIKIYREDDSFIDTSKENPIKTRTFDLLREDFGHYREIIKINNNLTGYISVFADPSYYISLTENLGKAKTKKVLEGLNDLILKDTSYFDNKNMGYHTLIKDSLLREFDGFSLSFLKIANVLNDFYGPYKLIDIFAKVNEKIKIARYKENTYTYEFVSLALDQLKDISQNKVKRPQSFYRKYLSCLEIEFRDSLNIFSKLNDFYNKIGSSSDKLAAFEEAIVYDIDQLIEKLTIEPSDYENLKKDSKNFRIGHYTSLDNLQFLIDDSIEEIDEKYRNRLRLTNARMLNDPMEGKALFEFLNDGDSDYLARDNNGNNKIYLLSASSAADSLPMWKQYADDTKGVFLEFSKEFVKSVINDKKIQLIKVFYIGDGKEDPQSAEIYGLLNKLKMDYNFYLEKIKETYKLGEKNKSELLRAINNEIYLKLDKISYYFKKDHYAYESEYRILVDLDQDQNRGYFKEIKYTNRTFPLPFLGTYLEDYDLKYQRLIFGPKAIDKDYLVPYIKYCLGKDIETVNSNIRYR
ncbi:DUF2971 domain-containing protein [Anaerococcus kampingiae]|uniref:DUF2971 domain-containing protein n=1 Tax=Anaerococcus kampingae TaxID=3115614 RepID=A0ABW9MCJ0_9FIRM